MIKDYNEYIGRPYVFINKEFLSQEEMEIDNTDQDISEEMPF